MTNVSEIVVEEKTSGPISDWLSNNGLANIPLQDDHLGVEVIKITPSNLLLIVEALKSDGFNYLQCQGGYDEGPGLNIVCFYNLIEMSKLKEDIAPREVRLKVFLFCCHLRSVLLPQYRLHEYQKQYLLFYVDVFIHLK